MPLLGDLPQLLKRLRTALLAFALPCLHLNQLTINLLQLTHLSGEGMATLAALPSLAGHCSKARWAHLDTGRLIPVALALAI
jgi:hypothetical protein